MRKLFRNSHLFILLAVLLAACHPAKKIVETPHPVKLKGTTVIELFDSLMAHQVEFDWLTAKASVEYQTGDKESESFDVNIRARKDSAIWISITPLLGLEAIRVLVTPDSIKVLNRLRKTYAGKPLNFLDDLLKAHINFEIMQAVLVGNYFPYQVNEKLKSVYDDSTYFILSTLNKRQTKRVLEEKDPTKPIIQDFWVDGNYKINRSKITDDKLDRTLEAEYGNFTEVNGFLFPHHILVTVKASAPLKIKVDYSKISVGEEQTLPFNIPDKYEKN